MPKDSTDDFCKDVKNFLKIHANARNKAIKAGVRGAKKSPPHISLTPWPHPTPPPKKKMMKRRKERTVTPGFGLKEGRESKPGTPPTAYEEDGAWGEEFENRAFVNFLPKGAEAIALNPAASPPDSNMGYALLLHGSGSKFYEIRTEDGYTSYRWGKVTKTGIGSRDVLVEKPDLTFFKSKFGAKFFRSGYDLVTNNPKHAGHIDDPIDWNLYANSIGSVEVIKNGKFGASLTAIPINEGTPDRVHFRFLNNYPFDENGNIQP